MNNTPHLSIIVPTIRIKNLIKYFNSLVLACKKYSFEVIFISPFPLPEELMNDTRVAYIRSFANPTVCFNIGASLARGTYVMNSVDDGLFVEDSLDEALTMMEGLPQNSIINFIYEEGCLDADTLEPLGNLSTADHPEAYWSASFHSNLRLPGINPDWKLALHFIVNRKLFEYLGYLDTRFSYVNMNLHIFSFEAQKNGVKVYNSPKIGFKCSHLPGNTSDHGPINLAHSEELPIFTQEYSNPIQLSSISIQDKDSWKNLPSVWGKRFKTK